MTNSYKILAQENPEGIVKEFYTPPEPNTSAVMSSIVVANTRDEDRQFSIYAQRGVPLGATWATVTGSQVFGFNNDKYFYVNDGTSLWAYPNYTYQTAFKSIDGAITWTPVSFSSNLSETYSYINSITYQNEKFILVWDNNSFSTSDDGTNWTDPQQESIFTNGGLAAIIPTQDKILAISSEKEVLESSNGTSWSAVTSNLGTFFTDAVLDAIANSNGNNSSILVNNKAFAIFLAYNMSLGDYSTKLLTTSDNGVTWVDTNILSNYDEELNSQLRKIYYLNNNVLVLNRNNSGNDSGKIAKSSDSGTSWTLHSLPVPSDWYGASLAYFDGLYYICFQGSMDEKQIYTSENLTTFTQISEGYFGFSMEDFYFVNSDKIIITRNNDSSVAISTKTAPVSENNALFYLVTLPGRSSTAMTLGLSLGYGDAISVGGDYFITYTAFGSEVTE
jgi:hypothetical protein